MAEPATGVLHPMFTPGNGNKNAVERYTDGKEQTSVNHFTSKEKSHLN